MEPVRIEMSRDALSKIVQQAMFLGQLQYRNMVAPEHDKVKQREAKRYLQQLGFEPKVLDEWVQYGFIHKRKDGKRNSAVYYSLIEIQQQVVAVEMKKGNINLLYP